MIELSKEELDKLTDEEKSIKIQDAIRSILESLAPDLLYFMVISKEDMGVLFGNTCPVCTAERLVGWIEINGISHDAAMDGEIPDRVM